MSQQVGTTARDAVLVEDASLTRVFGFPVLEPVPSPSVPYELTDPFILVHEGRAAFRIWPARTPNTRTGDSTISGMESKAR
jgi:hypothetical protein